MIKKNTELEIKIKAGNVDLQTFKTWANSQNPEKYLHVVSPDVYWDNNGHVIRHRRDVDGDMLTVKKRLSNQSTRERLEIDIPLQKGLGTTEIEEFFIATGFNKKLVLTKDSHIWWIHKKSHDVTLALYDVWEPGKENVKDRYIEVEIEKGADITPETGKRHLRRWLDDIQYTFDLSEEALNLSLFEIFTGQKYLIKGEQ